MSFMKKQVTGRDSWYVVDGPWGTEFVPADIVGKVSLRRQGREIPAGLADYCENREAYTIERRKGYGARLSAPGYLDCTPWAIFDTEREALDYLEEEYPDDEQEED